MADGDGDGDGETGRPEGLADKFWNPADSTVRVGDLSNSYNELTASFTRKTEDLTKDIETQRLAKRPESADKYDFRLPDSVETPPGFQMVMQPDHPLVAFWREQAWNNGMDQAGFEAGVAQYVNGEIAKLPVLADEHTKLGENGGDRFKRVGDFMKTFTTDEEYSKLGGLVTTAEGVQIIEKIMDKQGVPFHQSGGSDTTDPEDKPDNQPAFDVKTKRLMNEDAYRKGDHAAVEAVRNRWAKAYTGTQEPERNAPRSR